MNKGKYNLTDMCHIIGLLFLSLLRAIVCGHDVFFFPLQQKYDWFLAANWTAKFISVWTHIAKASPNRLQKGYPL